MRRTRPVAEWQSRIRSVMKLLPSTCMMHAYLVTNPLDRCDHCFALSHRNSLVFFGLLMYMFRGSSRAICACGGLLRNAPLGILHLTSNSKRLVTSQAQYLRWMRFTWMQELKRENDLLKERLESLVSSLKRMWNKNVEVPANGALDLNFAPAAFAS